MKTFDNILPYLTPAQATAKAKEAILLERSGEQLGLYSRFNSLNISMGKYFRFGTVNLFAGLSGNGKSYLLNLLTEDFLDVADLNKDCIYIPIVLHFCLEMSATNEILRSCAADLGISYSSLLSSEYDKSTKNYNILSDEMLLKVDKYLEYYNNKNILFFEVTGNTKKIYATIERLYTIYKNQENEINKKRVQQGLKPITYKFITNFDHTLLIDTLDEKSTLDLMGNVGKMAIALSKDFGAMVNLLGQLNNAIEDIKRITNPALHYPQKSDIYAQGQLYNACDNVFVIHQPQLLKIELYGKFKRPTKDLIHLIKLKSRHGRIGSIWLRDNLTKGTIEEYTEEDKTEKDETIKNI